MPKLGNYEVWIRVDGEKLPEYGMLNNSASGTTEITCWIPSEVGKAFEICYKDSIRAFATGTSIVMDGNLCHGAGLILLSRQEKPLSKSDTLVHRGVTVSNDSYRPFVFSSCQLTDDDGFISLSSDPGQITIIVEQCAVGKQKKSFRKSFPKPFPKPMVHERAKKGIVQSVELGPERFQKATRTRTTTTIQRLVTFKFKYRPLDVLQADGIAPCSTSNNREVKVTLECNSEEARIQLLKEEIRVLEAQQRQKRKRSDSNISRQRLKRDPSFILDNNVIDLTTLEAQQPQKHKLSDSNISQQRLKGDQSFTDRKSVV